MERTYQLLHSLTENQKALLCHCLSFVPKNNIGREKLLLKLADYLLGCKTAPSNRECLDKIYGKGESGKKIINLKKRLNNKILDYFISDYELELNTNIDDQDYEWIIVKKKLAQFYSLFYSGKTKLAISILDEALAISKQYEHYHVVVECLRFKKWMLGTANGVETFKRIQADIKHYEFCAQLVSKAVDSMCILGIQNVFKVIPDHTLLKEVRNIISELKKGNKAAKSNVAAYYIMVLEIYYQIFTHQFKSAQKKCITLEIFIKKHKSVNRKQRIASVCMDLSRCQMFLKEFESANQVAGIALNYLPKGSFNYSVAKEQEFYTRFYGDNLLSARESLEDLLRLPSTIHGDFRHSKYNFFQACIFFKEGKFERAAKILSTHLEISKDKEGWNIAIRILELMCAIEQNNKDEAHRLTEALRKYIQNRVLEANIQKRYTLIVSFFRRLSVADFDFSQPSKGIEKVINELSKTDQPESWNILGPEMIPVHCWAKIKYGLP